MTHGRPALCGTAEASLTQCSWELQGSPHPRSVSCALALEADLLLQQETPLCGDPRPETRPPRRSTHYPRALPTPGFTFSICPQTSRVRGPPGPPSPICREIQMQPRTGRAPRTHSTAGACGELRDPGGRRRSHVSEQRERGSGQVERRDGGEGKGRKPRRRYSRSECLRDTLGPRGQEARASPGAWRRQPHRASRC